jgi:Fic family protein
MQKPLTPPPLPRLLENLSPKEWDAVVRIDPLIKGQYLHWDQVRHRTPPSNYSLEMWWAGIRLSRNAYLKDLPFTDKSGRLFHYGTPDPVLQSLHHIDLNTAGRVGMDQQMVSPEDRNRYLVSSLIEEAITSSQLEGAATTREEAKAMLRSGRNPRDRSEQMIMNNYLVMDYVRQIKKEELTPELVLEMHRIVCQDTLDDPSAIGRLRLPDERVHVMNTQHSEVLHTPPAAQELEQRLERLCAFANQDENDEPFVHPVLRAIILHFILGYDHPFVDGNGRTARALFYWSMARQGYWLMEYISISRFLREAPAQYSRAYLHTETDSNDTTYFLLHQLNVIEQAIQSLYEYLSRKVAQQQSAENLLRRSGRLSDALNHRQVALLSHALKHPGHVYTVESHRRSHRVTYQTARTDLLKLADFELLEKGKRGRAYVFYAPMDLKNIIETTERKPKKQHS